MLNRGLELLKQKQEDSGLKLIKSVPANFPKSKIRVKAFLALGEYFSSKRQYDLAVKQYQLAAESEGDDQRAGAL